MKWISRIIAIPMGALVGVIAWILIYMAIFDSLTLLPLSTLALKLSPGIAAGVVLAYFYPGIFLWFWTWEVEDDLHVDETGLETTDSNEEFNKSSTSKSSNIKKT